MSNDQEDQDEDLDDEEDESNTRKKSKSSVEAKYEAKLAAAPKNPKKSREAPKETKELVQQQSTYEYAEDVDMEESKIEDLVHESLRQAPAMNNKRKAATSPPEVESSKEVLKKQKTAAKKAKASAEGDSDDEDATPDTNKDGTKKSDDPERQARTVFVGNLPVTSMTKGDFRKLKSTFGAFGAVESIRFRSIAFAELLPRKIAFITGKLHPERDVVNAYIVFANKDSVDKAVKAMNGQLFLTKHVRVDTVAGAKVRRRII